MAIVMATSFVLPRLPSFSGCIHEARQQDPSQTPVITAQQSADLPIALNTTRRNLLRAGIGATLLPIGGSLLLAGCNSSSDDDDDAVPAKPQPQPQPALASTFALAVLPDTQFYSRYATDAENQQFMRASTAASRSRPRPAGWRSMPPP